MSKGRFVMLGSGGSMGIPVIACPCEVCQSNNPKNKRTRPAGFVQVDGKSLLIDAGPDFRDQALANKITHIDGMLLTHTHADHTAGLDDLRIFYFINREPVPCLLSAESLADIKTRFAYLFAERGQRANFTAQMDFQVLEADAGTVEFMETKITYMSYHQGGMKVTGFRFGDFAYLTDICDYDQSIFDALAGVRKLVVSALRFTPSHVHFTVQQAVAFVKECGVDQAWFTHMAHELDHEATNARLPEHIRLGYDGLEIDFNYS